MFGQVAGVFGRSFIVGFFMPAALFVAAQWLLLNFVSPDSLLAEILTGLQPFPFLAATRDTTVQLAAATSMTIALAFILQLVNNILIRLFEGYYFKDKPPFCWLATREKTEYDRLVKEVKDLRSNDPSMAPQDREKFAWLCERFPNLEWLMPTKLGNVIRAFEIYPIDTYGIDAVYAWPRLQTVIPKDYLEAVDAAESNFTALINIFTLLIIIGIESMGLAIGSDSLLQVCVVVVLVIPLSFLCYQGAVGWAGAWGRLVKSCFDVFRLDLLKKMGYALPKSLAKERAIWNTLSRTFVFNEDLDPVLTYAEQERDVPEIAGTGAAGQHEE